MIKELNGKHVLIIILSFFGIIFIANGFLIYFSQSSWTGLETHDAYRKGVKYNQQLSSSEAQNKRGWSMNIIRTQGPDGLLSLTAEPKDKKGESLTRLNLSVELKRPTHEGIDRNFSLKETDLGVYKGDTKQLPMGKWYLFISADRGGEILFRSKNELYLR